MAASTSQQAIVPSAILRRIQSMAERGKPLNIAAVKRHAPKLIEQVYKLSPFVGWKGALKAAGLSYRKIKVELEQSCVCRICDAEWAILTPHLRKEHDLTADAYRKRFPGAELMSEAIRAKKLEKSKLIPHWEPLWSREYALDRLHEFHLQRFPLNYYWVMENERALAGAILNYFQTWDRGLELIGLDPAETRLQRPGETLDKWDVIHELKRRHLANKPLNSAYMTAHELRLLNAARRRFGSYRRALEAAGIRAEEVEIRPVAYTVSDRKLLVQEAQRIAALKGKARYEAAQVLHREFEKIATSCFGSWGSVAEVARVPAERLLEHRFPNQEMVLEWLAEWVESGKPFASQPIFTGDKGLYNAICRQFGSFAALKEFIETTGSIPGAKRSRRRSS